MRERYLAGAVIEQLDGHAQKVFADEAAWSDHLDQLGISQLPHAGSGVHPDPVKIATEGALWGSIRAHGLLQNTVIVSDGAGQFRLDDHADCWIRAERLVHKLDSFNGEQRRAIEIERELIWWLYRDLKLYKEEPSRQRAAQLRARFKRIFSRKTGFASLDRLLKRLLERKGDLLRVLDRPEIPLHTNGSENDIRRRQGYRSLRRDQTKNLRRNSVRSRSCRARRLPRSDEDMPEARRLILRLSRTSSRRPRCAYRPTVARSGCRRQSLNAAIPLAPITAEVLKCKR